MGIWCLRIGVLSSFLSCDFVSGTGTLRCGDEYVTFKGFVQYVTHVGGSDLNRPASGSALSLWGPHLHSTEFMRAALLNGWWAPGCQGTSIAQGANARIPDRTRLLQGVDRYLFSEMQTQQDEDDLQGPIVAFAPL